MSRLVPCLVLLCALSQQLGAQQAAPIDLAEALGYFEQARHICAEDAGKLWGISLDGPMMFVDRATRMVVANRPHRSGLLATQGEVYTGRLPEDMPIANTAMFWEGMRWTMVIWPLPGDELDRASLLAHELWHRVQADLGLQGSSPTNAHLDTQDGRVWLRMEWRALAEAMEKDGDERVLALEDALTFRAWRRALCGEKAAGEENDLELNEGLAEYTGVRLSGRDPSVLPGMLKARLIEYGGRDSLTRSFAYASGPVYGILLDDADPEWRSRVRSVRDLGELLCQCYGLDLSGDIEESALEQLEYYGGETIVAEETQRTRERLKSLALYRTKLIDSPILVLRLGTARRFSFNPNGIITLDDTHLVYKTLRVSDEWGILNVTGDALMIRGKSGATSVHVPSPATTDSLPLSGPGWTLELEEGWAIESGPREGDYHLVRKDKGPR